MSVPRAKAPKIRAAIDINIATPSWQTAVRAPAAVARKAALAALGAAALRGAVEVSIELTSDARLRHLNAQFRGLDKPTNVLSFPAGLGGSDLPKGMAVPLGDIAIAKGVLVREAKAEGKSVKAHLTHLVVHGVLHLLGYDHESERDAMTMERLEKKILAGLGIADPYAAFVEGPVTPHGRAKAKRA